MPGGRIGRLFLVFLLILLVLIVGDEVQIDGMYLRDLEFGFAIGAAKNLAFFHFVFVHIDFSGTFRATDHSPASVRVVSQSGGRWTALTTLQRIIYRAAQIQSAARLERCERHSPRFEGVPNDDGPRISRASGCWRCWCNHR